ncbi:hypothetical protein [Amycolatopsis sp. H20-H5]|uniref:hypothetical protein n=1 Tax=Amycolatopsis sp. H20-H5 TaxID=3046309 RepID=UPI002DBC4D5F|nr:hypothetical protein [Amycolatopsis sp. H20-H5]MEC3976252.1 hypothetical protein [Amycolatopsis sp. H20-H5]
MAHTEPSSSPPPRRSHFDTAAGLLSWRTKRDPWGNVNYEQPTVDQVARATAHASLAAAEAITALAEQVAALHTALDGGVDISRQGRGRWSVRPDRRP